MIIIHQAPLAAPESFEKRLSRGLLILGLMGAAAAGLWAASALVSKRTPKRAPR